MSGQWMLRLPDLFLGYETPPQGAGISVDQSIGSRATAIEKTAAMKQL